MLESCNEAEKASRIAVVYWACRRLKAGEGTWVAERKRRFRFYSGSVNLPITRQSSLIRVRSMKCHECGQHQADSNAVCCSCGAAFSTFGTTAPKITIYQDEPSAAIVNRKVGLAIVGLIALIGLPFVIGSGNPGFGERTVAENQFREKQRELPGRIRESNSMMAEVCMENAMQLGADEVGARANCYNDPEALETIRKQNDQQVKVRNMIPAREVADAKLLIYDKQTDAGTPDQPFTLRLILYDKHGKPASSDGEVVFSFSPEGAVWGGFRNAHIYKENSRVAYIEDEDLHMPLYEFSGYTINKSQLEGATEIEITARFADSVEASARYTINYVPTPESSDVSSDETNTMEDS